jgi:protein-S-isoprenylcysteine O-methyltransferase Ste14
MITAQYIVFATCWVIFLLYWIIKARSVKPTQEKRSMRNFWRAIVTIFVVFLFFESFRLPIPIYPLNIPLTSHSEVIRVAGVILTIAGFIVALLARKALAGNWSASDKAVFKKEHELITTGVYHYVRHPMYLGFLLMFLGTALFAGTISAFILFLFVLFSLWFSLKREEELLIKHFPVEYAAYKKRVKAFIPFIW